MRSLFHHRLLKPYKLLLMAFCTLTLILLSSTSVHWLTQQAIAQTPASTLNAGFYHFKVGKFKAATISDGVLVLPPSVIIPLEQPAEVQQALTEEFQSPENFVGYTNILYLDTGRNKVLIDTGSGNAFLPTLGRLATNLTAAGIDPGAIDSVILTHAHIDHIGGLTHDDGSLTFPNAKYYISQTEWNFWTDPNVSLPLFRMDDNSKQQTIGAAKKFLGAIGNRTSFFQPGNEVIPGITAIDAAGHTPGQSAFLVKSGDAELMVTADVFFSDPLNLEHPDWEVAFDTDPAQAVNTRKRVLKQLTNERKEVLAYHMPFPGLGHVRAEDDHYEWKPMLWQFEP